jgi:hypothetical protein
MEHVCVRSKESGPYSTIVMPGLVPGIHVFLFSVKGVDGRDKPGHDTLMQFDAMRNTP